MFFFILPFPAQDEAVRIYVHMQPQMYIAGNSFLYSSFKTHTIRGFREYEPSLEYKNVCPLHCSLYIKQSHR
jgi:hypothetical protein